MKLATWRAMLLLASVLATSREGHAQAVTDPLDLTPNSPLISEAPLELEDDPSERNLFERLPRHEIQASLNRLLKQELPFCARSDYAPGHDEALCALSKADLQRCPALARACETSSPAKREPQSHSLAWISKLADILFWAVLAALAIALTLAISRILSSIAKERGEDEREPDQQASLAEDGARVAREIDAETLLARAQNSATQARYSEAFDYVHGALVHALGTSGHIVVDPARTNGDYLRELRQRPDLYARVRELFRSIESVQFGGKSASAPLYRDVYQRVTSVIQSLLQSASVVALYIVASSMLSACSPQEVENPELSPHGYHILSTLLHENGTKVRKRIREIGSIDSDVAEILALGELEPQALKRLLEWVELGGSLTLTMPVQQIEQNARIAFDTRSCSGRVALGSGFASAKLKIATLGKQTLVFREPESSEEVRWITATCDERPYVAATSYGDGTITLVAEASLFSNASLSIADNAYFAVSLLSAPGSTLELVGPWTGGGATSPVAALRNAGLGPTLLQLLVFGLLFAWRYGSAFGKRRDPVASTRRAFVEHVRALGAIYERAKASRFALASYGAWAIDRLRERAAPGEAVGVIDLAAAVARKTGEPEANVVQVLAEARHAQESPVNEANAPQDLQTLQKLEALVMKAGGSQ